MIEQPEDHVLLNERPTPKAPPGRSISSSQCSRVRVGAETFPATARRATPAEADRLWPVVAAMPSYAAYREATAREIPLVLVTRTG
ncbi:nitroreductase/quinone reductase family protein [Streptomyces sp. NPDC048270]|uniref:nitroreductase/quinone reductase family protein n=1 Tax=Streptomyces sp. NPDC048270 TaxID=3154615 RepID=UPI0033F186BB